MVSAAMEPDSIAMLEFRPVLRYRCVLQLVMPGIIYQTCRFPGMRIAAVEKPSAS